ncbi:SusC/RagA family TonB-linked outer membrane protein [Flavitalea sp. BT771]|uniref:SusC/RagA family TonB-linked outer membrane protein n=1 Tax=Flavitalea sp. BT771 TaxID=3063329 RepID=UPI0026E1B7FC|nr:SusC/RagA family TonB-linked outer membrane protein [Flavitalea sp. BT771]MDO6432237.1 SusC/RagA family TonB-linked outer membrane protein [Flavitalea sp. BT771]MDV6221147.1 SusC/RagA family TonB-linked outer membrane protein [Flavitalea sp. BT771]
MSKKSVFTQRFSIPLCLFLTLLLSGSFKEKQPISMSLEKFMTRFQHTHKIYFSYETDALKEVMITYPPDADSPRADPAVVLKKVLAPSHLTYEKVNNVYIIKWAAGKKTSLDNKAAAVLDLIVKGKVSDSHGPMAGVTVLQKGTTRVTNTNENGNFELAVSGPDAILVFTYVGYASTEITLNGRQELNVIMETGKAQELSGVVVTALGITRTKRSLGYSVGEIKGEDMNRVSQTNALNSMAGKVSGVTISSTGSSPTSSVSVVIRGIRSLNSDNQPLFVIDGVPVKNSLSNIGSNMGSDNDADFGNAISDLNPNDIESVSVLKGPSAAALYGSRAGNGVILITTKSGKRSNGLGITVSSSTEFDKPYHYLPTNQSYTVGTDPYTTPNGFNSWNGKIVDLAGTNTYRFGTPLNQGIRAIQWNSRLLPDGTYEEHELISHNNLKNFVQTGITSVNSLSIENATDKDNYRLSYTNTANKGIIPTTGLSRHNLALNIEHKVARNFAISSSLNYTRSGSDNVVAGNNGGVLRDVAYLSPSVDIRQMKNYWLTPGIQQRKALPPVGVDQDPSLFDPASDDYDNNPWFTLNQVKNSFLRHRLFGNVKVDYKFNPHFSAFLRYSQDLLHESRENKISKSYNGELNGFYGIQKLYNTESNTDFLATYTNSFKDLSLSASAGGNIQYVYSSTLQSYSQSKAGIVAPEFFNLSNIAQSNLRTANNYSEKAIYSLYATASLGYKDMAYLDLTGRNDWSSTLPSDNFSYFYPSASLSLLLNKIFHFGEQVNLFKLRGGWAKVGKDTDPYNLYGTIGIGSFGGITTESTSGTQKNPTLKPEQAISTELGIDIALFKSRLRFEGTVYQSDNKNQVLGISTPPSSGSSSRQINAGLVRSNGIELQIGGTILTNQDWNWNLSVNYTKNNSYIMSLANGVPYFSFWQDGRSGSWTYAKGQPIPNTFKADGSPLISDGKLGQLWDNRVATVTDKNSPYYGYPLLDNGGQYQQVGNGDFAHKEVVGNFNPKLLMGIQTSVSYKMFTLTASIDMRLGGTFFSQTYRYMQSDAAMARQTNIGIPIPAANKGDIPAYLKSNPNRFIKFSGLQQFRLVGGPTTQTGGFPYTSNGNITIDDGAFFPGVYEDGSGGYVENLGDMNLTKLDSYEDAVTAGWNFARMSMFDASYIKLREITLSAELPKRLASSLKLQGLSLGIYSRNIILWTKAKAGIDPEQAFQFQAGPQGNGSQFRQGIERYNISPWTIPMGIKLSAKF